MKKGFASYCLFIFLLVCSSTGLKSQDHPSVAAIENVQLCTDRTLYVSGENIFFSAIIFKDGGTPDSILSRILYVEIITPDGTRIAGGKYPVEISSSSGCLQIPEECITGIYYLKSYTRFMRNGSPDNYSYTMLKIVNPYKTQVLTVQGNGDTATAGTSKVVEVHPGLSVKITTSEKIYSPRDSIFVNISGSMGNRVPPKLCLSVVPQQSVTDGTWVSKKVDITPKPLQFYPETRGLSITGSVIDSKTRMPMPSALVNLSIIGDKDMMAIRTDSSGRYFFALPAYDGSKDIFLCTENIPGNSPEIFIENDFCPKPVKLPSPLFRLSEEELGVAYKLAVNQEITSKFLTDSISTSPAAAKNERPFYGDPTEILVMEKYIDLPTIEEYFNELPVDIRVRKSQGSKHFRFYTDRTEMTIYDPLVLVDWVAIDDIGKVLALQPKALDRIELVNAPYIKGNITYGGIISFVSKKNDFAGIDLPSSGTFINYQFLEDCSEKISEGPLRANLPDSRNTVYWNPDLKISENTPAHISFTAPDTPGKYSILLREISSTGAQVVGREEFEVVKN